MKVIGFTGGAGAGKTQILSYIKERYNCRVILADEVAHQVQEPGQECYERLTALLGRGILGPDGAILRGKMAEQIFGRQELLAQVNAIVHPAVRKVMLEAVRQEREAGTLDFLLIEAALLIECGYSEVVDELWYIYADNETRRRRLEKQRSYSRKKVEQIFSAQLGDEEFRRNCSVVIDNSRDLQYAYDQIDRKLGEYLWKR